MALTSGSMLGTAETYDKQYLGETGKTIKETPRTSLELSLKRLRQAAASVSSLRAEMVGESTADEAQSQPIRADGFIGDIEHAAYSISQMAAEIEQDVKAVLSRF